MPESRRRMLSTLAGAAAALVSAPFLRAQMHPSPQPMPSPNAPNQNAPGGLDGIQATKDGKSINPQNEAEIKADVSKLYDLVTDLKKQVDSADLNATLPLSVVKKAQQIEKLAKQIKERAKG